MNTNLYSLNSKQRRMYLEDLKDFYIPYRNSLGLDKKSTFGVEIEFNMPGFNICYLAESPLDNDDSVRHFMKKNNYLNTWEPKYETHQQIEIVSDVLKDEVSSWNDLREVLSYLKSKKCYVTNHSAAHVHVGKQIIGSDKDAWLWFIKLWVTFENEIIRFTNGENYRIRECSKIFSKPISNEFQKVINNIEEGRVLSPFNQLSKSDSIYFNTENFKELYSTISETEENNKKNTIEFRCPNGSLNMVIWQNNINFFCKMLSSCLNNNLDVELLDYYRKKEKDSILSSLVLCDLVYDNDFDKMCFLRQYYKDFDIVNEITSNKSKKFWK